MKKIIFILLLLHILFLFVTCSIDPTMDNALVDTVWEYAAIGTGSQLHFISSSEGDYYTIFLGEPVFGWSFTYSYDNATLSGFIDNDEFTVNENGKELTYEDCVYKYKPFDK